MRPATANPIDAPGTDELAWRSWPALRELPSADITGWRSAVILAAHPDDEVLGAGGTMSLLAAAGTRLRLIAVTDGEASHPPGGRAGLADRRAAETTAALRVLGAQRTEIIRLRLPDTGLAAREAEITAAVRELAAGFEACLAPWEHDVHADHEAVGRAARRAGARPLCYPIWTWHWARPGDPRVPWSRGVQVRLPASVAQAKRAAIACFASQLEPRSGRGPVLTGGTVAHFSRAREVLFR